MAEAKHIRECKRLIKALEKKEYFKKAIPTYNHKLSEIQSTLLAEGISAESVVQQSYKKILSLLHDVMREAEIPINEYLASKVAEGKIKNADQARKSVAGNLFQQFFAYTLAKNIVHGSIDKPVTVTTSVKEIIDQYAAIHVGEDIQKPDSDVIVYAADNANSPILNFSCKTSCRERAGQTYKWKLLCDLATCRCEHREGNEECPSTKYGLQYSPRKTIKMCFVTSDFYDELQQPQISAMFHFFDHAYVAKRHSPSTSIKPLHTIVDDINAMF